MPCTKSPRLGKSRCHNHGGASVTRTTTRLYARHLEPEQLEAFDAAVIGSLDQEIRLAKANLDWAVKQWNAAPTGGVVTSSGKESTTERLWVDIVREHSDHVRKLEQTRANMLGQLPPPPGDGRKSGPIRFVPLPVIRLDD